ncbi:Ubiquitin-conjugating enzyme E2 Z [Frankliniella fusca]|uniref:Ubiquitin-conjugating enzyme E2 Z n=1 Tax=Frankliniella fusca TaxID=407009 RepID=A0AAE1LBI9_9NEOP|nr:Ubiquitin-conjugating enzyme E2 Z [Frankliniella fusca]
MATPKAKYRIKRDLKDIMRNPPDVIFGVPDEGNFMKYHAIVMGPDETPYEKGFFYFIVTFPDDYPLRPPGVQFMTTGGGTVRFNPNLYCCGKVCLSILGTWPGPSWSPAQTFTSVLLSIQSLLNSFPYHNEPGHEKVCKMRLIESVLGMVRNDSGLSMPITMEQYIQKEFVTNYDYYEALATQKSALSNNILEDPLFPSLTQEVFKYDDLLNDLQDLKMQFNI